MLSRTPPSPENSLLSEGTLVFELTLPTRWPPASETRIYTGRFDTAEVCIVVCPGATMRFTCQQNSVSYEFVTPVLDLQDFASLKIAFSWGSSQQPMVAINGVLLSPETYQSETGLEIYSPSQAPTRLREHLMVQTSPHLTLEEERLIRSLTELQSRIIHADRFHLLEASGILRRLLLDTFPLVHLVNREYHCKLLFPLVPERAGLREPEGSTYTYVNLAPCFSSPDEVVMLPLDSLLSQSVVKGLDMAFSVRDVINFCANTKGGIHFDKPKSQMARQLLSLDTSFQPALVDASLHALADFSWCVLQGLRPLLTEIEVKRQRSRAG